MKQIKSAEEISDIAFGFMASKALFVALHCKLFSMLSRNTLTSKELAILVKAPENRISTLCTALTSIGILIRENERYRNSPGAEKFLVEGSKYDFGDYLRLQIDRQMYGFMQQLEGVMTNNIHEDFIDSYAKWMDNKKEAELYSESQHAGSLGPGKTLARMINFSEVNTLLDVAGGTGGFAIRLCEKYPNINITILDFPNVIKLGEKKVANANLSNRINFVAGDALDFDWPSGGFDAILMSYLYNGVPEKEIPRLANKAYNTMNHGGFYIIHDFMVENDRNGPHLAALWQLQHLAFTPTAKSLTPNWVSHILKDVGFTNINNEVLIPGMTRVLWGTKP